MTYCFLAAMMVLSLGKCCPNSPSFIGLKNGSQKAPNPVSECGRTVQPRPAMCFTVFKLVWDMTKVVFFSGVTLEV